MDELDDKWYPIELIIYATEHFFFFSLCALLQELFSYDISRKI